MKIDHRPFLDTKKIEEFYTHKDGEKVTYVCTSAINQHDAISADIFFRETPHPEFGNRYFGLYRETMNGTLMITNADKIENLLFEMIDIDGTLYYSRDRHDFYTMPNGVAIDGGRSYLRLIGDGVGNLNVRNFNIVDGQFVERELESRET